MNSNQIAILLRDSLTNFKNARLVYNETDHNDTDDTDVTKLVSNYVEKNYSWLNSEQKKEKEKQIQERLTFAKVIHTISDEIAESFCDRINQIFQSEGY